MRGGGNVTFMKSIQEPKKWSMDAFNLAFTMNPEDRDDVNLAVSKKSVDGYNGNSLMDGDSVKKIIATKLISQKVMKNVDDDILNIAINLQKQNPTMTRDATLSQADSHRMKLLEHYLAEEAKAKDGKVQPGLLIPWSKHKRSSGSIREAYVKTIDNDSVPSLGTITNNEIERLFENYNNITFLYSDEQRDFNKRMVIKQTPGSEPADERAM